MNDTPPIELIHPATLAAGVPYAYAAAPHGRSLYVFTAGACPLDGSGVVAVGLDVTAQSVAVMENLSEALAAAGAGLGDVVKTTVYVATTQRSDLLAAWDVVRGYFGLHDPPSSLLGVTVLGYPDQLVEVEAVAALAPSPTER
jgi:enamine deaminase RidA (YjgF/YER057c/UK114 family)